MKEFLIPTIFILALLSCKAQDARADRLIVYPESKQVAVSDTLNGAVVEDHYRWLEDIESIDVKNWMFKQDSVSRNFLKDKVDGRDEIKKRLEELNDYKRHNGFIKNGSISFYLEEEPEFKQPRLIKEDLSNSKRTVFLDPVSFTNNETAAIMDYSISPNGRFILVGVVVNSSRYFTYYLFDVNKGTQIDKPFYAIRTANNQRSYSNKMWLNNESAFIYRKWTKYYQNDELMNPEGSSLFLHVVGTDIKKDQLVYESKTLDDFAISNDGKYLVLSNSEDGENNTIELVSLKGDQKFNQIVKKGRGYYTFLGNRGDNYYFFTNFKNSNGEILSINIKNLNGTKSLVSEEDDTIVEAYLFGNRFCLSELRDVKTIFKVYGLNGNFEREIDLPVGLIWNSYVRYMSGITGNEKDPEVFIRNLGITSAGSIYKFNLHTGEMNIQKKSEIDFDYEQFITKQVFYYSKDGSKIPMFITHKKGIKLDGSHPTHIYVYGSWGWVSLPFISSKYAAFLEMGGILLTPNIRGGGAYGERWMQDGIGINKLNSIDDVIGAAEWAISNAYTNPSKLSIEGGSSGSVAAATAAIKRTDLFNAVILEIPLADMVRVHKFRGGKTWLSQFGSPENPKELEVILEYSPYNIVKKDGDYPNVLIAAGEKDTQATPLHAYKLAAKLQNFRERGDDDLTLLRIDWGQGHGANKPWKNRLEEQSDELTFLKNTIGLKKIEKNDN